MSTGFTEQLLRDAANRMADKKPVGSLGPAPEQCLFSARSFCLSFGLTPDDLQEEIRAGRLIASGIRAGKDTTISIGAYLAWSLNPNVPAELKAKIAAYMKAHRVS